MHKYILLCAALVLIVSCTKSKEELTDETPALLFFLYTLNDYTYMGNHQLSEP